MLSSAPKPLVKDSRTSRRATLVEQEDETIQPATGVHIDAIGPVVLTPGVLDEEGAIVTPATFDTRHHVNLRMADSLDWQSIALAWAKQGAPDTPVNASEVAAVMGSVALIDPDTIATPVRVWADSALT